MRTELVSIATDTAPIDGAFYLPDAGRISQAAMLFHGNTMNFYTGAPRFLPPTLTQLGFACLAFNRRGHDILTIRNDFVAEGAAFQLTRDGIADNNFAASWMATRGFPHPVVIGHSNGGMLGVQHVHDHPETPALILLSAHRGGRTAREAQLKRGFLAGNKVDNVMAHAEALIAAGRGRELMLLPGWWFVLSAESYVDRMTQMPDILELAPTIKCPVLYIRGDQESSAAIPAEDFQRRAGGRCDVAVIPDCDHFYNGREAAVCDIVKAWLADVMRPAHVAE
jgi:pimeloyl-ACP methyl ester carboxylesterase